MTGDNLGHAELLIGEQQFITPQGAVEDAKSVIEYLNTHRVQVFIGDHLHRWKPNTLQCFRQSGWGWYGVLTLGGPQAPIGLTYYKDSVRELVEIWEKLDKGTLEHTQTEIDRF